jgi:hypothetical protein
MGFLEPVFVPAYWAPPSLFDLASRTRFDIESFIFLFAIGGIASVLYEAILDGKLQKASNSKAHGRRRGLHFASLLSTPIVFSLLLGLTKEPRSFYRPCFVCRRRRRYPVQTGFNKEHVGGRLAFRRLVFRLLLPNHFSVS